VQNVILIHDDALFFTALRQFRSMVSSFSFACFSWSRI